MRKLFVFLVFPVVCACSTTEYYYVSQNAGGDLSGKNVMVLELGGSITNTKTANTLNNILNFNGMKSQLMSDVIKSKKRPEYVASARMKKTSWQTLKSVPVWGKTGINSINTNSYGGFNGSSTYRGGGYTTYDGSYTGTTNTTVNYDYGVTGYQNVVVNNYISCFFLDIRELDPSLKFEQLKVVHDSRICADNYVKDSELLDYVTEIYSKYPMFVNSSMRFHCKKNGDAAYCERDD